MWQMKFSDACAGPSSELLGRGGGRSRKMLMRTLGLYAAPIIRLALGQQRKRPWNYALASTHGWSRIRYSSRSSCC